MQTPMRSLITTVTSPVRSLTKLTLIAICVTLATACDSRSDSKLPTSPSAPGVPVPPNPAATHTLSGTVKASGLPAVGARVTVLETSPEPNASTDENGFYSIPDLPTSSFWGRTLVRFSQPGHFTEYKRPNITGDMRLDVALDPLVFIRLGEVVMGTARDVDAVCAGQDYEEVRCQRFAVVAPSAGTLEVTLTSRDYIGLDIVSPDESVRATFHGSPYQITLPAIAGTHQIRVLCDDDACGEFALTVSLR